MKVVFVSNFLNHHQLPFCLEMQKLLGCNYKFIATTPLCEEQSNLGYDDMNKKYDFVHTTYDSSENLKKALCLIDESDVTIFGSAPIQMIAKRLRAKKLTFQYAERLLKTGNNPILYIPRYIKLHSSYPQSSSLHLLSASAFSSMDFAKFGMYKNRAYKWGYFPEVKIHNNIENLIEKKEKYSIMWAGRMIDWKHPELAILTAKRLKKDGYNFSLNMVGTGYMEETLKEMAKKQGLENCVHFLGAMPPEKVREYMEKSQIYLFTSNFQEGWGAVLNEAMNSGCAIVASHSIGSVPFLLKNKKNGMIFKCEDEEDLYKNTKLLIANQEFCKDLGKNAYRTMRDEWNAKVAAERFVALAQSLLNNNPLKFPTGPCSTALLIENDWM